MKAQLLVADSASHHPDNVVSALRIGITRLGKPKGKNLHNRCALLVGVQTEASEAGDHEVAVSIRDVDGKVVWPHNGHEVRGVVKTVPQSTVAFMRPLPVSMNVPFGRYEVSLVVDGEQRATWPLEVHEVAAEGQQDDRGRQAS